MRALVAPRGGHLRGRGRHPMEVPSVAERTAFLGPRPAEHQVNHRDGDKTRNIPANLEYLTALGNSQHASRTGLLRTGERHQNSKLTVEQVAEIRRLYQPRVYSMARLGREFGVCAQTIHVIIRRKGWVR